MYDDRYHPPTWQKPYDDRVRHLVLASEVGG
jgi:hypothetical protein